jgi:hypothetical protein
VKCALSIYYYWLLAAADTNNMNTTSHFSTVCKIKDNIANIKTGNYENRYVYSRGAEEDVYYCVKLSCAGRGSKKGFQYKQEIAHDCIDTNEPDHRYDSCYLNYVQWDEVYPGIRMIVSGNEENNRPRELAGIPSPFDSTLSDIDIGTAGGIKMPINPENVEFVNQRGNMDE